MAAQNTSSTRSAGTRAGSTDRSTRQQTTPPGGQQTQGIVNRVKESAAAQLSSQKDRGTDALGSVAQAVRSSTSGCATRNRTRSPVTLTRPRTKSRAGRGGSRRKTSTSC